VTRVEPARRRQRFVDGHSQAPTRDDLMSLSKPFNTMAHRNLAVAIGPRPGRRGSIRAWLPVEPLPQSTSRPYG